MIVLMGSDHARWSQLPQQTFQKTCAHKMFWCVCIFLINKIYVIASINIKYLVTLGAFLRLTVFSKGFWVTRRIPRDYSLAAAKLLMQSAKFSNLNP